MVAGFLELDGQIKPYMFEPEGFPVSSSLEAQGGSDGKED